MLLNPTATNKPDELIVVEYISALTVLPFMLAGVVNLTCGATTTPAFIEPAGPVPNATLESILTVIYFPFMFKV
jgi:hypothetical protein